MGLFKKYPAIGQYVKGLFLRNGAINNEDLATLLKSCINLEFLSLDNAKNLSELSLKGLTKLKVLVLFGSYVQMIKVDDCPELKIIDLSYTEKLNKVLLNELGKLEELRLINSLVQQIKIENFPELTGVFLSNTKNLSKISLKGLSELKKLSLKDSSIQSKGIEIENCPQLVISGE